MSLQNALRLIQKLRKEPPGETSMSIDLQGLIEKYGSEFPCSVEELRKAFVIDWEMKWAREQALKK